MAIYIKNNTISNKTWSSQLVLPAAYYQVKTKEEMKFSTNSVLLTDIGNGDAIVASSGDGLGDITNINLALSYLRKEDNQQKDEEGAAIIRTKMAPTGWKYQMRIMEFETSLLGSLYCKEHDDSDFPDKVIKFFNAAGIELTDQPTIDSDCVETTVDFEPQWDYELIGGRVRPAIIPTTDVRMWIVAVPDIPQASGGEVVFVSGLNFKFFAPNESFLVDGRTPKLLTYNATFRTNKLQFKLKHDAGTKHRFMINIEYYKP